MDKNNILNGGSKNDGKMMMMVLLCFFCFCYCFTITCLGGAKVIGGKLDNQIDTTEKNTISNIKNAEKQNTMAKFLGH